MSRRSAGRLGAAPLGSAQRRERTHGHGAWDTVAENRCVSTKAELRRWLVKELGGAPRILDCFCARGEMWREAYDRPGPDRYLGLDRERFDDERATIVCDSRRFLRHVDANLERFDLFDLDAFGEPLEHLAIICDRLHVAPGRRLGFALTNGTGFAASMNSSSPGLLRFVGMTSRLRGGTAQAQLRDEIISRAVQKCMRMAGLRIVAAREAQKGGGVSMRYQALLCVGA